MSSRPFPSSTSKDLAHPTGRKEDGHFPTLAPDLVALAQSGVSVTLASCDGEGRPVVGMAYGCRVRPDGTIRILLSRDGNSLLLAALSGGSAIAVTFTGAPDHRAFQVKAHGATVREALSDDLPEVERQCAVLADGLVEIGFAQDVARGYLAYDPDDLVAIECRPERVFIQTPGPGAGAELTR